MHNVLSLHRTHCIKINMSQQQFNSYGLKAAQPKTAGEATTWANEMTGKRLTVLTWWSSGTVKYAWQRSCRCIWLAAAQTSCMGSVCFSLSYTLMSLPVVLSLACWPTQIHSASSSLPPFLPPPCLGDFHALLVVLPRPPWLEESLCLHLWLWRLQRQTGNCLAVR